MKFLSFKVALYLFTSTIQPCIEYCYHAWAEPPTYYLDILDKLQKRVCKTVGASLAASPEPLACRRNEQVFSIGITLVDVHLKGVNWFRFLILVENPQIVEYAIFLTCKLAACLADSIFCGIGLVGVWSSLKFSFGVFKFLLTSTENPVASTSSVWQQKLLGISSEAKKLDIVGKPIHY